MQTYLYFLLQLYHKKGIPSFSKSQIETKVRSIAKTFTVENTCELPPPPLEVKITRLYILLLETNIVMNKK
jgi:translation initiation factor 2 beta subunit (eIF-2beta)/eIF-5